MFHEIPELDKKGLRDFGLITGGLFAGIFGLLLPFMVGYTFPLWPWAVCGVLVLWAFIAPMSLNPVYRVWTRIGMAIGAVVVRVVLGAVFFLVFTPIGLIMRARGHDPMARNFDADAESYRVAIDLNKSNSFDRPF